jgi:SAM-dependent methyltransferase
MSGANSPKTGSLTWEQSVLWLRAQPDRQELVMNCFYDDPVEAAARRFHETEEWASTRTLLANRIPGDVLDLGAGRGVASYAFAREGCRVTAVEPDPSAVVGRAAIETLARTSGLPIRVVQGVGEALPFPDESFDIVYGRAVLHHAGNLPALCREVARVLRGGGLFLAVREHVISKRDDLQAFLSSHPLHALYGGENAFLLTEYQSAIRGGGLRIVHSIGPYENAVNYWPATRSNVYRPLCWGMIGGLFQILERTLGRASVLAIEERCAKLHSRLSNAPGRHFAFLAVKR